MNKRFLAGVASVFLLTGVLSGCGQEEAAPTAKPKAAEEKEEVIPMLEEIVTPSIVTGAEVMNQMWATSLDASAAIIDGYHAVSVQEVINNWKQAHMQKNDQGIVNGNGALIYGICSPDLRPRCLEVIKQNNYGSWNFYYSPELGVSDQSLVPLEMVFSEAERLEEPGMIKYIVDVTEVNKNGETYIYQLFVDFIDGGYYLSGRTAPYTEEAVIGMETIEEETSVATE